MLKEASSCWADVPVERRREVLGRTPPSLIQLLNTTHKNAKIKHTNVPESYSTSSESRAGEALTCRKVDGVLLCRTPALDGRAVDLFKFHPAEKNKTRWNIYFVASGGIAADSTARVEVIPTYAVMYLVRNPLFVDLPLCPC